MDALRIAQFYIGLSPANFVHDSADVNQSGVIDILDALLVAQFYVDLLPDLTCGNTLPELENAFEVIDFTSQDWYGGPMGSGGGTYFVIQLNVIIQSVNSIDGVWIENRYYPPDVTNVTSPDSIPYVDGDKILINLDYRWIPDMPEHGQEASEDPPLENGPDYTGAALIVFTINGETKGFVVDSIRVLDPIYYP